MKKTKIFLADDHAILRDGLKHILSKIPEYEIQPKTLAEEDFEEVPF